EDRLRELLDVRAIADVEAELQGLAEGHRAAHADGLHDLLRRVGDLATEEVAARCDGDAAAWLAELERARRIASVRLAGAPRWIAVEDAALYRDALGCVPPAGLAEALLAPVENAVEQLLTRWARTHGPFPPEAIARRFGLVPAQVEALLAALEARGRLVGGELHPEGSGREWCDPDVLRRIRRRTLARLRGEVAPVEARALARFLPAWHGIGAGHAGERRLDEALAQLEGIPLPFSDLERAILPARVRDFDPRQLDERGALGQLVWVGAGALGERDGRIALYRRERAALLLEPPAPPAELAPLARALLDHLARRGASFFSELVGAARAAGAGDPEREALDALWDLVWAGLVTNDTFAPLRALAARGRQSTPARVGRRAGAAAALAAAGRWSLVAQLADPPADPTRRAHARALGLLDRWGVVARDALDVEAIPGGFSAVYPVLRAMEESGKLRRGHFVEGLTGAQFAFAGAVDQLRAVRAPAARAGEGACAEAPPALVLAATDPANPFGVLLPWPPSRVPEARPRRAAGAAGVPVEVGRAAG